MNFKRSSGILLHPSSLPGPYGIGDIGPQAHRWVTFIAESGCSLWQVLPLGPTGYGDSPYQCFSAFAGNPYLISIEDLLNDELLLCDDLDDQPNFPDDRVDFGWMIPWKINILDRAYERTQKQASWQTKIKKFRKENADWLEDFALFMALKDAHGGAPWWTWEPELRGRNTAAIAKARKNNKTKIEQHIFRQFIFFKQWQSLREHAHELGIQIIGDIPIFVAHDSADVWANPDLFYLEDDGRPTVVAGVPPDYFSATGQLWGNPLYRWDVHGAQNFSWWLSRIRAVLNLVDIVRIDHFRGFAAYWEVPGDAENAIKGRWVPAPGQKLFETIDKELGNLPIIAEDLGVITPDVEALRDSFNLPGMKILQFALEGDPTDEYLPHNYTTPNCVVYTGTHDNDTTRGWYERFANSKEGDYARRYLSCPGTNIAWDIIRLAWSSIGVFAIAPMQDFLGLGNSARMNYPGNPSGNWTWRMGYHDQSDFLRDRIGELNWIFSRRKQ